MRSLRDGCLALCLALCLLGTGGQASATAEVDACSAATVEIDEKAGPLGQKQSGGRYGFYPVRGKLATPPASTAPLVLIITAAELVPPDQKFKLTLRFVNRSPSPQIVLRPSDGSLEHLRFPHYDLFLRNLKTGRVYRWAAVGNRDRRLEVTREQDHAAIVPGAARDDIVLEWGGYLPDPTIAVAADYEMWMEYRFCGYEKRGISIGRDVEMPGVFKGTIVSNRALIHVH